MVTLIKQRKISLLMFVLLVFTVVFVTILVPVQVWAASMSVSPETVIEQDDFNKEFVLMLEDDLLINTQLSDYIRLGGDFESLSVSEVVYNDQTTITTKVFGNLKYDTGMGSITLLGGVLEGGKDVTADVIVEHITVPEQEVTLASEFAGGSGTPDDPYQIKTPKQLDLVREDLDAYYILMADIDLKDYLSEDGEGYNEGAGWEPIGNEKEPFQGSFDGNGYVISNLYINRSNEDFVGLFGCVGEYGWLWDVGMENVDVTGQDTVGGLVGSNYGDVDNCYVIGTVSGSNSVGGLVGDNYMYIWYCYANVNVSGDKIVGGLVGGNYWDVDDCYAIGAVSGRISVGGLVGYNYLDIWDSYAAVDVTGDEMVGGLVGFNEDGDVGYSYATGDVVGEINVGGLAGYNYGEIKCSYAKGKVDGNKKVGGLVGQNDLLINHCYAVGAVTGNGDVGGLIGLNKGIIYSSYYDSQTTEQEDRGKGEPRTTAEMQLRSTYTSWDFIEVWGIEDGNGYPMLRWQEGAAQSGFEVEVEDGWIEPGMEFQLNITDAMVIDYDFLDGSYLVTVYRELENEKVKMLEEEIEFAGGNAEIPVTLDEEGILILRVYVEGISYSNLVTVKVLTPDFAGGIGTPEDPFQIENAEQLDQVRHFPTAHFKLVENIDLGISPYNTGEGWDPIGRGEYRSFEGSFDGNGYVIENLYINLENENIVGLFWSIEEDAVLRNIKLENVDIVAQDIVGGLAGDNYGTIEGCYVTGTVSGQVFVGGLLGYNSGTVEESYAKAKVNGKDKVGGLLGYNYNIVSYSYAGGDVDGETHVGGLVGYNEDTIIKSYATGYVNGSNNVGGLVGTNESYMDGCYATGSVHGDGDFGGLVGSNTGIIYSSYYDIESIGQMDPELDKGEPKTSAEMKLRSTYEGWDFLTVWSIKDGESYPMLRWQEDAPQSGFNVDFIDDWAEPGEEFELEITDAMGEDGEPLNSLHLVTVYSDLEDKNVLEKEIDFSSGKAVVPVTLDEEGIHNLRIYVEGLSYSNLITLNVVTPKFKDGTGTLEDPFQIENAEQLYEVRYFPTAYFELINDIDLGIPPYNTGEGWEPIGNVEKPFQGSLDGNGFVIKNLTIDRPEEAYIGLFGKTQDAVLRNIKLENVNVSGKNNVGGLVGYVIEGSIENCQVVSGSVNGNYIVGGLVGTNIEGHITASCVSGKISSQELEIDDYSAVGGLVGENYYGVISNSNATGEVHGLIYVGGLVGANIFGSVIDSSADGEVTGIFCVGGLVGYGERDMVENSFAKAEVEGELLIGGLVGGIEEGKISGCFVSKDGVVSGEDAVGGLVGYFQNGEISNSYSEASVNGISWSNFVGGLVGVVISVDNPAKIVNCFAAGPVVGGLYLGGLVGDNEEGDIRSSYYDSETTGRSESDNEWGIPKTTDEMMQKATFMDWDFDRVWGIVEGHTYPYLQWQDNYGFTVVLAQSGNKKPGKAFDVKIVNATDISGDLLNGNNIVTVISNLEEGEVYSEPVLFENGNAIVPITLNKTGKHSLTVAVAGVPGQKILEVIVISSESGGSSRSSPRKDESPKPELIVFEDSIRLSTPVRLDSSTGVAVGEVDGALLQEAFANTIPNEQGIKLVEIEMSEIDGAEAYEIILPEGTLDEKVISKAIKIDTEIATITVPGNMLSSMDLTGAENISLRVAKADKNLLTPDVQLKIGDRPVIELGLMIDGKSATWSNENAPVTVSIPYIPTEEELADPEHITVWYIDGEGNVVEIPSGRCDSSTSTVIFNITHFSKYAVVNVFKTYEDLESVPWAKKPIEVLASKGILKGISETEYAPQTYITRADFLYSLVRTLDVAANFNENFDDINSDAYYYEEIGIAKILGITNGIGNNSYNPDANITRQDMMVLTERALRLLKRLEIQGTALELDKFADKSLIAEYAIESIASLVKEGLIIGSENKINPLENTTRAEAAVFLYRIYNNLPLYGWNDWGLL